MPVQVRNRTVWCTTSWFPHHFGFCPNEAAWRYTMRHLKMKEDDYPHDLKACTSLFQNKFDKKRVAIVTVGNHPPRITADLLVHEAMHVWRDIREAIKEDDPSSEFEAYAMQNISAQLFEAYEKTRGPLFIRKPTRQRP